MASQDSLVGPWGGEEGKAWSYVAKGAISHISITHGHIIDSIIFTSKDEFGNLEVSDQFGSSVGSKKDEIEIEVKAERLSSICGTYAEYNEKQVVTSLSFTTDSDKSYGPFGTPIGKAFGYKCNYDESISGFHGRSELYLDAIGAYIRPKKNLTVGPWGSQVPGSRWSYEPKGVISNIFLTHGNIIGSIRFTSQDENGTVDTSRSFGDTGGKSEEIVIDIKNEKLNYISGTIDTHNGYVSVTSLSFATDKKKTFGPFGTPRGSAFSLLARDRGFVGFHGRSGSWLDSIGVYLKPLPEQSLGQWGNQQVGNDWSFVPKGVISHISLTHEDAINSIQFTSTDDEGHKHQSKTYGRPTGTKSEIAIDIKSERLNNISGTIDKKSGYIVVTSLSFSTEKSVFGPFGAARGTNFSALVNYGSFGGFFGRAGSWLDAIGVVVKPTV